MSILIYFCLSKIRNPSKSSKILLPQKKKEKEKDLIFRMMTEVLWSSAGTSFTTQFLKILETPAFKITCLHNVIICVWKRKLKCLLEHRRPFFFPFWFIYLITQKKKRKLDLHGAPAWVWECHYYAPVSAQRTHKVGKKISKLHF